MSTDKPNLLHRDDVDMDLASVIEAKLKELHPDCKVVFAGDDPQSLPPELLADLAAMHEAHDKSLFTGTCIDCGAKMPNFPDDPDDMGEDWQPAKGWGSFRDMTTDEILCWQCPACDQKEEDDCAPDE